MMDFDVLKIQIVKAYIDYLNNFLSEACFAQYYNIDLDFANKLLAIGRYYFNKG